MFFFSSGGPVWLEVFVFAIFAVASISIFRGLFRCGRYREAYRDFYGLGPDEADRPSRIDKFVRTCTNPLCRRVNRHAARFCSQCGQRLE